MAALSNAVIAAAHERRDALIVGRYPSEFCSRELDCRQLTAIPGVDTVARHRGNYLRLQRWESRAFCAA